jgi:hypothetical protein
MHYLVQKQTIKGGRAMEGTGTAWSIRQGKKGVYREWMAVRVPFEIKRELERKAKQYGLSLSDAIRLYLEKGLKYEAEELREL